MKLVVANKTTTHAKSENKGQAILNKIYSNKTLINILYNTYYIDYITLGKTLGFEGDQTDNQLNQND